MKKIILAALVGMGLLFGSAAAASATSIAPCEDDDIGVYGDVDGREFRVCVDR